MGPWLTASYIIALTAGALVILLAVRLHARYRLDFLSTFLYFTVAFNIAGFLNLVGRGIGFSLLKTRTPEAIAQVNGLFMFLMYPFIVAHLYLYARWLCELAGRRPSGFFKRVFFAVCGLQALAALLGFKIFLDTRDAGVFNGANYAFNMIAEIYIIALPAWLLLRPSAGGEPSRRRLLRAIGISYIAFNLAGWILSASYLRPFLSFMRPLHLVLPFFLSNIPALLLFERYLKRYPLGAGVPVPAGEVLDRFADRFGISAREMEILEKILQGKTNKEIERELFISSHTVKNHLYNAYQKLGIKSRLQAVRIMHDHEKGAAL